MPSLNHGRYMSGVSLLLQFLVCDELKLISIDTLYVWRMFGPHHGLYIKLIARCLQVLAEQRANLPKEVPLPPQPIASTSTASSSTPNRRSQHEGGGGGGHFSFDLGSLIGRDSSKSPKFPEKMLKVLDGNLQRIAMGQDPK